MVEVEPSETRLMKRSTTVRESNIDIEHTEGLEGESDANIKLLLCSICKQVLT